MITFDSRQIIDRITRAFPARTLLLAATTFLVALWGLNELLVSPRLALEAQLHENLRNLTNTYTELGSMDLNGIVSSLENEAHFLADHRMKFEESLRKPGEIPFLVSRLQREADNAGLRCEMNIQSGDSTDAGALDMLLLNMTFDGTFGQTVDFFQRIDSWPGTLLVRNFDIAASQETPGQLIGQVRFSVRLKHE